MKGKKLGLTVLGIVILVIGCSFGINWWVNEKLPQLIAEKNETPYHVRYKEIKISIFSKTIEATGITIIPKNHAKEHLSKNGIFGAVKEIKIDNFALFPLLFSNKIEAQTITVKGAKITLFKDNDQTVHATKNVSNQVVAPFQKIIKVNDVNLEKGSFFIVNLKNNKTLFAAQNVTIQLDAIAISDQTLAQKIPFTYQKYAFSCDSLFYLTREGYQLKADKINATNTGVAVNRFSMVSQFTRREFVNQLPKEKDLYTLKAEKIAIEKMDWGFKDEILFFKTNHILLDQVDATIYRSKMPEDDLSTKPLYNELLREMDFELKVDTLSVVNSNLVYEEEKSFEKGAGILEFSSFNLQATHVNSGFRETKLPDVKITIDCKFMKRSPMRLDWRFNVLDKVDRFTIKGRILNFDTGKLAVFTKPYLNVTTQGTFEEVYFNFAGNRDSAGGDFALKYRDLKVKMYRKNNPDKESKFKSWVGNLLLKDDSNGKLIEHEIRVERIKEKSFFNYFWRCIAEGMKKTLV